MSCSLQPSVLGGSCLTHKSARYQNSSQGRKDLEVTIKQNDRPEWPLCVHWDVTQGQRTPGQTLHTNSLMHKSLHHPPLTGGVIHGADWQRSLENCPSSCRAQGGERQTNTKPSSSLGCRQSLPNWKFTHQSEFCEFCKAPPVSKQLLRVQQLFFRICDCLFHCETPLVHNHGAEPRQHILRHQDQRAYTAGQADSECVYTYKFFLTVHD